MRKRNLPPAAGQYIINFEEWEQTELPLEEPQAAMQSGLRYFCMGSGSSGNCSYLGCQRGGILIDAGVKDDDVWERLHNYGIPQKSIKGILLTHDHSDHIKYVYRLLRANKNMRLYCTNRVMQGLLRKHSISKQIKEYHIPIFKEIPFRISDFEITAFEVPHDGTDNMGFSVVLGDSHFVLATDMGEVSARARHYMTQADYLVIEANYDLQLLLQGRYPAYLKARIQTANGHMDNVATATFLKEIVSPRLKYVFLCHLSHDNNTADRAIAAVRSALESAGVSVMRADDFTVGKKADIRLMALPRFDVTPLFKF